MIVILSEVMKGCFLFFIGNVGTYEFGLSYEFWEDILNLGIIFCTVCFSQKVFFSQWVTDVLCGSEVVSHRVEDGDTAYSVPLWSKDFSALVSGLLERLKTILSHRFSLPGSLEAVVYLEDMNWVSLLLWVLVVLITFSFDLKANP